ncbi:Tetrathionate reductase sensory transduction histidine kinase [Citrobacter freundii]|uniref:Tetrathionate reductase sensory transduction histidine kinase n=1 Tax=Citrobacter freundii TaxID=546 RepID=A0A7G2IXH8_CITFR|nr:Tetrathionate reductase sensory transduction histidine kinase [Citrobacter freundii]
MGRNVVRCLTVLASLWMLSGAVRAQTWNIGVFGDARGGFYT